MFILICFPPWLSDEKLRNILLFSASENSNAEVIKPLLADKKIASSIWDNYAKRLAAENGHEEVVKLLPKYRWEKS